MPNDPVNQPGSNNDRRIPWLVKILYSAFVAVLVPYCWQFYGPANFLWLCDTALVIRTLSLYHGWLPVLLL